MAVVGRPHGVRGLVRVQCHAENPAKLPRYSPLLDERGRTFRLRWQGEVIAELAEIVDGKPVKLARFWKSGRFWCRLPARRCRTWTSRPVA